MSKTLSRRGVVFKKQLLPMNFISQLADAAVPNRGYRAVTHTVSAGFSFLSLWQRLPGGSLETGFQTPGFLDAFFHSVAPAHDTAFHVCEIEEVESGAPIVLFPYVIHRRGPIRVASFPDFGLADQGAPVLARNLAVPEADFPAIMRRFTDSLVGVDVIDIHRIPPQLRGRKNPLYEVAFSEPESEMFFLDLRNTASADWKGKSVFKETRSKARKLASVGVRFLHFQTPAECSVLFETLRVQRRQRFAARGQRNSLENRPGYIAFYQHLMRHASPDGPTTAFCLRSDDEIVSAAIAFTDRETINGVLISIGDDTWRRCSPGVVLIAKMIEWAEQAGLNAVFFGTGIQDYKQRFGGDTMELRRIFQPLTAKGKAFALVRQAYRIARGRTGP